MNFQRTHLAPALLSALVWTGCGGPTTTTLDNEGATSDELELAYAGIRAGDEAERFADTDVAAEDLGDREVPADEDEATRREVDDMRRRPDVVSVVVAIRYGNLVERGADGEGIWRLKLTAHGGLIHRARQILDENEPGNMARLARNELGFGSGVRPGDSDGALVLIEFIPAAEGRMGVTLETEGLSVSLPLAEILDHRSLHRTAQGEVALHAYRRSDLRPDRPLDQCRGGGVHARVRPIGDDGIGRMHGVVTNADGERIGHFRGAYGFRGQGNPVFFGKMIGRDGRALARVRGTFERIAADEVAVRARLQVRDGRATGALRGIMSNLDGRGGRLEARWALDCDAADTLPRGEDLGEESDDAERTRPERPNAR